MLLVDHYIKEKVDGGVDLEVLDHEFNAEYGTISVKVQKGKSTKWIYIELMDLLEYTYVCVRNSRTFSSFGF